MLSKRVDYNDVVAFSKIISDDVTENEDESKCSSKASKNNEAIIKKIEKPENGTQTG